MPKHIPIAQRISRFRNVFLEFLRAVSLRSDHMMQPQRGLDGLFHVNLNFLARGGMTLEEPNRHGYYSCGEYQFLSLQWKDEPLDTAVKEAKELCPNISETLIKRTLRRLMIKTFEDQIVKDIDEQPQAEENEKEGGEIKSILEVLDVSQIDKQLIDVIEWLCTQAIPQTVYVPIEDIEGNNITIGEVEFSRNDEHGELNQFITTLQEQGEDIGTLAHTILTTIQCYAKITIVGDGFFARAEAVRKVQEAIHIISFGLSSTMHQPSWAKVRIVDLIFNIYTLADDPDKVRIGYSLANSHARSLPLSKHGFYENLKPPYKDVLNASPNYVSNMFEDQESLERSVENLLACYQTNGEIAKRIRRAVTWYGKAVNADTHDEQFVNLAIALESLLIGKEGDNKYATSGSITQTLRERTAFLLKNDFESRCEQLDRTRTLYGLRSAIVHNGESITVENLREMDDLVKRVTIAFLHHNFSSWPDFQKWVARQKFTQKMGVSEELE